MSVLVIRPKPNERERAVREGWPSQTMLDWPEEAVSAMRRFRSEPWKFTTRADIRREKIERMEEALRRKRQPQTERRVLCVWVFWCPGIGGFAFYGWWAYFVGVGGKFYSGGGVKGDIAGTLLEQVRALFPTGPRPLLAEADRPDDWMPRFARMHARGTRAGKPQGRALVWATVKGDVVVSVEGNAVAGRRVWIGRSTSQPVNGVDRWVTEAGIVSTSETSRTPRARPRCGNSSPPTEGPAR